jgi:hypothetical protein
MDALLDSKNEQLHASVASQRTSGTKERVVAIEALHGDHVANVMSRALPRR